MTGTAPEPDTSYYHEDMATFGDRLAAAREEQGLEQKDVARRLGVKTSTVLNWEEDRAEPRANRVQMLAGILGVSITWLLSGQGEGPSPAGEGPEADLMELLAELRRVRVEQARLTERLAILEKRLRAAIG